MKKLSKTFGKVFSAIFFTGALGFLSYAEFWIKDFTTAAQKIGWIGLIALFFICAFISLILTIVINRDLFDVNNEAEKDPNFFDAITADLNKMMTSKEYSDVIRVGSSLSRALWIAGEYSNRITIGNLVYEAACKNLDNTARATTLIDDIGWTYVLINNLSRAKTNILEGIELAKDNNRKYWTAKGYRHLFNIELLEGQSAMHIEAAKKWLDFACDFTNSISDPYQKAEMQDGIDYDKVELLIQEKKYNEAHDEAERILQKYKSRSDKERMAKLYSLLGKIAYITSDFPKATSYFLDGLTMAEKSKRKDEIIKNSMGLSVSKHKEGDISRSSYYMQECNNHIGEKKILLTFWSVIQADYDILLNNQ